MEEQARAVFRERFGAEAELLAVAPGRVNLIGEHTDYSGGFVFPAAIDRQLFVAASAREGSSELYSIEMGQGEAFDAASVGPPDVGGWTAYAAGIAWALREECRARLPNIRAVVQSDIPIGSGISSSAAIEMAFAVAWNELASLDLAKEALAKIGQKCENSFVGVSSGIMDQMASALGTAGNAMFLDTRSLEIEYTPIPAALTIVICDTGKPRSLTESAYNERRSECEKAARALGVPMLRDATPDLLEAHKGDMEPVIYRRARHVITENERCLRFRQPLHDCELDKIDELMRQSHVSLRDDYEVSSRELDAMAEAAWSAPGCVGARMTGAGFGGACVALVEREAVNSFITTVSVAYTDSTGINGEFFQCEAVDGARLL